MGLDILKTGVGVTPTYGLGHSGPDLKYGMKVVRVCKCVLTTPAPPRQKKFLVPGSLFLGPKGRTNAAGSEAFEAKREAQGAKRRPEFRSFGGWSVDRMDSCFICGTHGLVGQLVGDPNTV